MKIIFTVIIAVSATFAFAQPVTHSWSTGFGGITSVDDKVRTVVDNLGNIYTIGEFQGTRTFGSATLTAFGSRDVFVAKFSSTGACQWAVKCSGPAFTTTKAGGIAIDNNYNLYITGTYNQSITVSTQTVTAMGQNEIFIARLDNAGNCAWLKSAGFNFNDVANDIVFDGNNSIYVAGSYEGYAFFGTTFISSPTQTTDLFLAKYDLLGNLVWVQSAGGSTPNDNALAVKVDNAGNPIISGYFGGTSTFGTLNVTSLGSGDLFVARYNTSGTPSWVTRAGGAGQDEGKALGIDANNNVYVGGTFSDTIFVAGTQLNDNGYSNALFIKMNSTGVIQYAKRIGGSGADAISDLDVEPGGHLYVTGYFTGNCSFNTSPNGNGVAPSLVTSPASTSDAFVAKYNGQGVAIWVHKIGGTGADFGKAIVAIGSGKALASGNFSGTVTMGSSTLTSSAPFSNFLTELNGGTLGIFNNEEYIRLSTYPNPANSFLNLELPVLVKGNLQFELLDLNGKTVILQQINAGNGNSVRIDLKNVAKGFYNIKLSNDSFVSVGKVIIE